MSWQLNVTEAIHKVWACLWVFHFPISCDVPANPFVGHPNTGRAKLCHAEPSFIESLTELIVVVANLHHQGLQVATTNAKMREPAWLWSQGVTDDEM